MSWDLGAVRAGSPRVLRREPASAEGMLQRWRQQEAERSAGSEEWAGKGDKTEEIIHVRSRGSGNHRKVEREKRIVEKLKTSKVWEYGGGENLRMSRD